MQKLFFITTLCMSFHLPGADVPKKTFFQKLDTYLYLGTAAVVSFFVLNFVCRLFITKKAAPKAQTSLQNTPLNLPANSNAITQKEWQQWLSQCDKMPSFRELNTKFPLTGNLHESNLENQCKAIQKTTQIEWSFIGKIITAYKKMCDESELTNPNAWTDKNALPKTFFNIITPQFNPMVLGFKIPADARIETFGDQHGAYHNVRAKLRAWQYEGILDQNYTIINPEKNYIFGLGDYVDSGTAGLETLVTLLMLKLQNPHNVILVRGNHEDCNVNQLYFQKEVEYKFPEEITKNKTGQHTSDAHKKLDGIPRVDDTMPVAVIVGCDNADKTETSYLLLAHACLDSRDNLAPLYAALKNKKAGEFVYKHYQKKPRKESDNQHTRSMLSQNSAIARSGYYTARCTAHDGVDYEQTFIVDDHHEVLYQLYDNNNKLKYGKKLIAELFKDQIYTEDVEATSSRKASSYKAYLHAVIRGHQHARGDEFDRYGFTMKELFDNQGCTQAWNADQSRETTHKMPPNSFYTILAAPGNEYGEPYAATKYPGYSMDVVVTLKPQLSSNEVVWSCTKKNINEIASAQKTV